MGEITHSLALSDQKATQIAKNHFPIIFAHPVSGPWVFEWCAKNSACKCYDRTRPPPHLLRLDLVLLTRRCGFVIHVWKLSEYTWKWFLQPWLKRGGKTTSQHICFHVVVSYRSFTACCCSDSFKLNLINHVWYCTTSATSQTAFWLTGASPLNGIQSNALYRRRSPKEKQLKRLADKGWLKEQTKTLSR